MKYTLAVTSHEALDPGQYPKIEIIAVVKGDDNPEFKGRLRGQLTCMITSSYSDSYDMYDVDDVVRTLIANHMKGEVQL